MLFRSQLQPLGNQLLYRTETDAAILFDLRTFDERPLPLPSGLEAIRQVRIQKDRLYVLHAGGLSIYRIQ